MEEVSGNNENNTLSIGQAIFVLNKSVLTQTNPNYECHKESFHGEVKDMLKHLRNETIKIFIKIFQVKNKWLKLYLIVLMTFLTGLNGYMVANLITSYVSFEVLTKTRLITEASSIFPKVTICNNQIFQTEFALEFLQQINMEIDSKANIFQKNLKENLSFSQISQLSNSIYVQALNTINRNFTDKQKQALAHSSNDLFQNCLFNFYKCTGDDDFIWYFDRDYGNCYIFNSGFDLSGDEVALKTTSIPGRGGGLSFSFYVGFNQNLTLFNALTGYNTGAIIRIENNSYLTDNSFGELDINIPPGFGASIKIHRSFQFSLSKPYSNCDISNEELSQEKFTQSNFFYSLFTKSHYQYTRQACLVQCWQQSLIQNCSCSDASYLSLFDKSSVCSTNMEKQCQYEYWNEFTWDPCLEACPLECNLTEYRTDLSFLSMSGEPKVYLIRENANLMSDFVTQEITNDDASKSFVSLGIFYDSLSYELVEETPKMNVVDLIASIGGNLSLFLGVSIFSFCEIIEIFLEVYLIRKSNSYQ